MNKGGPYLNRESQVLMVQGNLIWTKSKGSHLNKVSKVSKEHKRSEVSCEQGGLISTGSQGP